MTGHISPSSVFVVSGGARGITAQCVIKMAERYRCRFILLGRSAQTTPESAWVGGATTATEIKQRLIAHMNQHGPKPTPALVQKLLRAIQAAQEIHATLDAISRAGGHATYLSVDVTNAAALADSLSAALAQSGPPTGLIHGAGSLADKLIEQKTGDDFDLVYHTKITGLANLLRCLPLHELKYLILFSSVAGFYGNVGQSDYALANEILNKLAHQLKRRHPQCRVVSINWGPWDGGMVTPAIKKLFADREMLIIPPDDGAAMLIRELEADDDTTQIVIGTAITQPPTSLRATPQTIHIQRHLSLDANPFLHDHVIGEHAVLPTVFSIAWLANMCEQQAPGYRFFQCTNYHVLKGVTFDDTLADGYHVELKRAEISDDNEVAFDTLIWSEPPGTRPRFHYRGHMILRRTLPAPPVYETIDLIEREGIDGAQLYQNGTLFHGPLFRGVERVLNITPQKLTMQCRLPIVSPSQQGQFPIQSFNPYQADIQYQCMLIWVRHIHQAGSLPLRADCIEYFRSVTPGNRFWVSMDVQKCTENKLVAAVTTHDEHGHVSMRVTGAEVTISARLNDLFRPHQHESVA